MRNAIKTVLCLLLSLICLFSCACDGGYLRLDSAKNPLQKTKVGGSNTLTLLEEDKTITLENEKVRIVFHKINGSIKEYVNKETKQYLVKDAAAGTPFIAAYYSRDINSGKFSYQVTSDTKEKKELQFVWEIRNKTKLIAHSRLNKGSDTVSFDISVVGNVLNDYLISVEYPVFNNIKELCEGGNDQFVSPVATGFLFDNPAKVFNTEVFKGIDKTLGMYPSGWEYPMQFMAYLTKNIGGFYFGTTDGGCTIKSFTFTGTGDGTLQAGIYHFLDDIAEENVSFDYEIQVSNLTKGYWEEAGDRYFEFAKDQSWMQKGLLEKRTDINKGLFEDTVLVNFGIVGNRTDTPGNSISTVAKQKRARLYDLYKETLDGKMFNIYLNFWQKNHVTNEFNSTWETYFPGSVDPDFKKQITDNGDQMLLFEFNTLFNANYKLGSDENALWRSRAVQKLRGGKEIFTWTSATDHREWWFVCPSVEEWKEFCIAKDTEILKTYGANGLYHDVGTAAVAPMQCYNTEHAHGTRVNIIPDYVEIERLSKELSSEFGQHAVGQELIYEQLLPYVDYFQARANGGLLSWMENDRFRALLEAGLAMKIPLFDYVYHAYGGLRVDGFMMPYYELGDGYYYAMAYTVLNGGLPEYNYEFSAIESVVDKVYMPYLEFINEIGAARTTYGKEFLVYGAMKKAPTVDCETVSYQYLNSNVVLKNQTLRGTATFDRVITSAFEHDGKIGIFMMNISEEDITSKFILEADRLYGIKNAKVKLYDPESGEYTDLAKVRGGEAKCSVELPSRKVVMLVLEK